MNETDLRRVRLTERLRLEPVSRAHVEDLWQLHQDDRVAAYYEGTWSVEDAARYGAKCEAAWASQGLSKWVAYDRADGRLVGRGGLSYAMVDGETRLEVGWTLLGERWGHGFATEIGRAGLAVAFDELGADEVVAYTEVNNARSRAVMERLGMCDPREITHHDAPFVAMLPINRPVTIVMKDRTIIHGRRLNEDTATVQVLDDKERLLSIAKRDVEVLDVGTKSPMPAYADRLTPDEIADTVAYLLTLREP